MTLDLFGSSLSEALPTMQKYSLPYQGSKRAIATQLMDMMLTFQPNAKYFVDLFCGGCAMSFEVMRRGLTVIANDYDESLIVLLKYIFERIERGERSKFGLLPEEWYVFVSREEFMKYKGLRTPYSEFVRIAYSFGNNRRSYAYSSENEVQKHLAHNIVVYQCEHSCKSFNEKYDMSITISNKSTIYERRIDFMSFFTAKARSNQYLENIQRIDSIMRLPSILSSERIERLEGLSSVRSNISFVNLSYDEVIFDFNAQDTIVYCDIPYKDTERYKRANFNYEEFYNWFANLPYQAFLSEYNAPCKEVLSIPKRKLMNDTNKSDWALERLYINKYQ